jgi:hypothetical protein
MRPFFDSPVSYENKTKTTKSQPIAGLIEKQITPTKSVSKKYIFNFSC